MHGWINDHAKEGAGPLIIELTLYFVRYFPILRIIGLTLHVESAKGVRQTHPC